MQEPQLQIEQSVQEEEAQDLDEDDEEMSQEESEDPVMDETVQELDSAAVRMNNVLIHNETVLSDKIVP